MRYYFDIVGDDADEEGTEFSDIDGIAIAAKRFLLELVSERFTEDNQDLELHVRDNKGSCIYQARIRLGGVWK